MAKDLQYTRSALKGLRKMPEKDRRNMQDALKRIASGDIEGLNIRNLQGRGGMRVRVGQYRAVYTSDMTVMTVEAIAHRKDIYKTR